MLAQDVQTEPLGAGPCNTAIMTNRRFILPTVSLMHVYGQAQLGLVRLLAVRTAMWLRAGAVRGFAAQSTEDPHNASMARREMDACL